RPFGTRSGYIKLKKQGAVGKTLVLSQPLSLYVGFPVSPLIAHKRALVAFGQGVLPMLPS
ncbi:hypothetical protein, partial [Lentilactobacillus parabuchneri]|uniref:hypothetical protein n=1 Tax=Lentilactobacillus parabuchneri TaxID=152331 RepID=UPI0021A2DD46